jgi:hypothetical protein
LNATLGSPLIPLETSDGSRLAVVCASVLPLPLASLHAATLDPNVLRLAPFVASYHALKFGT